MPDIGKLLWPKSVAVVGASSDTQGLRGRILEIMLSHPFAGTVYPVSRSATEVQGLKAYPSVDDLPSRPISRSLIIPAQFVPQELERCGEAGIKAAIILSSGFAEETGETGTRMQSEIARDRAPLRHGGERAEHAKASPISRPRSARPSARRWTRTPVPLMPARALGAARCR